MKLIGTLQGVTAIHYLPEEILPTNGVQQQILITTLRDTYRLTPAPTVMAKPVQNAEIPPMTFISGRLDEGELKLSILQMVVSSTGIMVASKSTDDADRIYDHLISLLDTKLGFKLGALDPKKLYLSSMVVQFNSAIENAIEPLNEIIAIVRGVMPATFNEIALKRLAFGAQGETGPVVTLDTIGQSDFVIERRSGTPFSENRYFSTAPLTTSSHFDALGRIEKIVAAGKL